MQLKAVQPAGKENASKAQAQPQAVAINHTPQPVSGIAALLNLQRTHGNRFVQQLLRSKVAIQPKLAVSQPGDEYEQEADRIADQVISMPVPAVDQPQPDMAAAPLQNTLSLQRATEDAPGSDNQAVLQMRGNPGGQPPSLMPLRSNQSGLLKRKCACGGEAGLSGEYAECQEKREDILQRRAPTEEEPDTVPPIVHEVLRSPGQPLDTQTRAFMEPRFGYDFSHVRVHTDARAAESARAVKAQAYTVGGEIVFGAGRYAPESSDGKRLLAHELTHVAQQQKASCDEETVHCAAADEVATDADSQPIQVDTTASLLDLIANVEQVHSRAIQQLAAKSSEGTANVDVGSLEESQKYINGLAALLKKLRDVASSGDESLKQHVLEEFTAQKLVQAEGELRSKTQTGPAPVNVREMPDEGIATVPLEVSHPQSAAEIEADRVAALIISGAPVSVEQPASVPTVYRQGEWAIVAGEAILAFEAAGPGEAEAAIPGPGWIALGATLLVAGVLIGAGTLMMSRRRERTQAREQAEPTTGTPPPPPPDLCRTAIKILTQYERLAQKFGLNLPASRIEELNRLRDAGTITINHIPGSLRDPFPMGTFGDMTLAAIRQLCGM